MIYESDREGSGTISFATFKSVMAIKMQARHPLSHRHRRAHHRHRRLQSRDPREEAIKAFRLFDDDETGAPMHAHPAGDVCTSLIMPFAGTISLKNLRRVAKELGENMTDDELQARSTCRPCRRRTAL